MNKYTVALCYFAGVEPAFLQSVRDRVSSFGYQAEYLVDTLINKDPFGRNTLRLGRGYDLVVIVTDGAAPHVAFEFLGNFNHVNEDPWATAVVATSSAAWNGYQTVIAIESHRYIGHFRESLLPHDLSVLLQDHRHSLRDRGLSHGEWNSIRHCVTPEEWERIRKFRRA